MDDFAVINQICKWLLIWCLLMLLYFGMHLIKGIRKEKQWERDYRPSLQTLTVEQASSHETLAELKHRNHDQMEHQPGTGPEGEVRQD